MARPLRNRGVALLPVERELLKLNACAGFAKRAWGAGWGYGTAQELAGADHVFAAPHEVAAFIAR